MKELHLSDKYDVIKIVRAAQLCKDNVEKGNALTSSDQIMDVARSLSAAVVSLVKLVNARYFSLWSLVCVFTFICVYFFFSLFSSAWHY